MAKKVGKIFLGFLILLVVFVALLPTLLSTSWGTSFVLGLVNRNIPGKFTVENVSLGWIQGQEIQHLKLLNAESEELVSIDQLKADSSLLRLFFQGMKSGNVRLIGLKGMIAADQRGATNIEAALGLKQLGALNPPVFLENVNAEIKQLESKTFNIKSVGLTRQEQIKGQFSLDVTYGNEQKVKLHAEHFPSLVLGQIVAMNDPKLGSILPHVVGDFIDVTMDQSTSMEDQALQILVKSPFIKGEMYGTLTDTHLLFQKGSLLEWNLPEKKLDMIQLLLQPNTKLSFLAPLNGQLKIDHLDLPLGKKEMAMMSGSATLNLLPTAFQIEGNEETISLEDLKLFLNAPKNSSGLVLNLKTVGKVGQEPFQGNLEAKLEKDSLLAENILTFLDSGLNFTGNVQLSGTHPIDLKVNGILRERDTEIVMGMHHEKLDVPELRITIQDLHSHEWKTGLVSDVEGTITLMNPKFPTLTQAAIDHVTIPWKIDPDRNSVTISFTSSLTEAEPGDNIFGTIRLSGIHDEGMKLTQIPMQVNLKLQGFNTDALHKILPEREIRDVVGPLVNAEIVAERDASGIIRGGIDLQNPKQSDAFLKKFTTNFTLQNDQRDIIFDAYTEQKIGATQFQGTLQNFFNEEGKLNLHNASIFLKGNLKHFPVLLMTRLITGDKGLAQKLEAVFGANVDADINAEVKNKGGPFAVSLSGLNGQLSVDGRVENGFLLLNKPMTASVKITPQLEQVVLREFNPVLSSIVSADAPIQLNIAPENFYVPLESLNLTSVNLPSGSLSLGKVKFSKDGQLGKIVSFLGVNTDPFDVWFTPLYFSLQEGKLSLSRTDLLIGNQLPLASWGTVNFNDDRLNLIVALTTPTLKSAFKLKGLPSSYVMQVPIKGTIQKPQLDLAKISTKVSALVAMTQGPEGLLLGKLIETATTFNDQPTPPPTTSPLPWADLYTAENGDDSSTNAAQEALDLPIKEIKKGAKKLMKGIFGK